MLLIFLLVVMIVSIAQSASSFFLTVYMREIGASSSVTGAAIGVQALSELPFYFIAAWLLRKTAPGKVLIIAIFGTALRLLLYYLNSNPYTVIGIESLNGVTWTLLWLAMRGIRECEDTGAMENHRAILAVGHVFRRGRRAGKYPDRQVV